MRLSSALAISPSVPPGDIAKAGVSNILGTLISAWRLVMTESILRVRIPIREAQISAIRDDWRR